MYSNCTNLRLQQAGLGARAGRGRSVVGDYQSVVVEMAPSADSTSQKSAATFPVLTINQLFASSPVALIHLDIEGSELKVLRAAAFTLDRDRPVVGAETDLARGNNAAAALSLMESLGYLSFLVDEAAGYTASVRNVLHIHRDLLPTLVRSPALNLAAASGAIFQVNASTLLADPRARAREGASRPFFRGRDEARLRWRTWAAHVKIGRTLAT